MQTILIYGTFDLFHVGHKNILKRTKELYPDSKLIVGVTSDEFDRSRGKTNVVDPLSKRIDNVNKTGYADEIIIETYIGQKIDDIKKYKADIIVFGSDWKGKMDYLNEYCEVIYLPRTEGVSSTSLRNINKNAIVVGGSSDIGIDIIQKLLFRGYKVYATYHNTDPKLENDRLVWIKINLAESSDVYSFIDYIKKETNIIDVFIYNASMQKRKTLLETTDDYITDIFNVNVFSCYKMIRDFYNMFDNNCKIVVIGSQMGLDPHSVSAIYGMSKSCLHSMVKNLVKEFDKTHITINAVVPGFVETRLQKDKPQDIRNSIYNKTALHRFATVDEITKGVEFCLTNDFVNGSLIEINGGYNYK